MKGVCPEFEATSLRYPDWQARRPRPLPVGPGAAWHSQNPGQADGRFALKWDKTKETA